MVILRKIKKRGRKLGIDQIDYNFELYILDKPGIPVS